MHSQAPYHYGATDLGYAELAAPPPLAATERKRPIVETGCAEPDMPNSLKRLATEANSYENDRLAEASAGRTANKVLTEREWLLRDEDAAQTIVQATQLWRSSMHAGASQN